jgi:RecB family exonuclease
MARHGPYSHSRLESFRQCPRKFRLRYVDAIPARRRGIEAFMGSRVHEALEFLYRELGEGRAVEAGELLGSFHARWDEAFDEDVELVREDLSPDHYRAVGVTCLENYWRLYHPFPDAARTLGLERLVEFHLDGDERYPIRGYVDRMVRGADDVLEIHDYKTSSRMPRPEDFAADGQLALYQIGLGPVFEGQSGVRLVWHYLVHGKRVEIEKSPAELDRLRERTRAPSTRSGANASGRRDPERSAGGAATTTFAPRAGAWWKPARPCPGTRPAWSGGMRESSAKPWRPMRTPRPCSARPSCSGRPSGTTSRGRAGPCWKESRGGSWCARRPRPGAG